MPLVLWIYATPFTSAEMSIPFGSIISSLAVMLVPVLIGMGVRAKSERWAYRIEKTGSYAGILVLVVLIGSAVINNSDVFKELGISLYLCAGLLGLIGFVLGMAGAKLANLPLEKRRAVAFETSIQNSPLAFAIILASFPESEERLLWVPMLYALLVLLNASVITLTLLKLDKTRAHV